MPQAARQRRGEMIRRSVNRILDKWAWGVGIADVYSAVSRFVLRPKSLRSFLHGTWFGHALHPLLTDLPGGALTVALILDLLGIYDGANWATLVGFAGMLLAALAGIVDLDETDGKARQYGGLHAGFMFVAMVFYLFSVLVRFGAMPGEPVYSIGLAAAGYVVMLLGAYIGGGLGLAVGNMGDRHAWRGG